MGFFFISSLPFWAVPPLLHPAPWGKTIIFRIILSILIFFFVYQITFRKDIFLFRDFWSRPVKLILGLLTLLLSLFFLSTIFSQDISFSLWGSPYRAGGFINFAFYIILSILAFLTINGRDWKKLLDFSICIGVLVTLFGIGQYFKMFSSFIVSAESAIPSTMGNSSLLAIYLSFLFFIALSLGIKEKSIAMRTFYFSSILLFIFGIFLSGARSTYLGLIIGLIFFLFFYPKKITRLKIAVGCFLIFPLLTVYYLNAFPTPPNFIEKNATSNRIFSYLVARTSLKTAIGDLAGARFSTWNIGLQAVKEKPILGWGPENFSIGFDKYYDPSLPQVGTLWWDRAHNFLIEYATTGGMLFLIIYLLLIGTLIWQLQKVKKQTASIQLPANNASNPTTAHGLQAAFIAYLINIFFTFDSIDTYLLFFLFVGYCLYLISSLQTDPALKNNNNNTSPPSSFLYKWKKPIITLSFIILIIFIWLYNLKPLFINKELNWAEYYSTNNNCQKAIEKMEKVLPSHSIIDEFVMLQYSDVLRRCQITNPKQSNQFIQKDIEVLEQASKLRPTYTRTWLLLGGYSNLFVSNNPDMKIEEKEALLNKAIFYFEKTTELSPLRQETFLGWSDTYILWEKYNEAKEKADQCIKINDKFGDCYWQKALCNVAIGEITESEKNIEKAKENGFQTETNLDHVTQLLDAYLTLIKNSKTTNLNYYRSLAGVYRTLTTLNWKNYQYHASLAYVYRTLGEYEKARKEASFVIQFSPESKQNVEEFLKTLPY